MANVAPSNPVMEKLLAKLSLDEKISQMVQLDLMTVTVKDRSAALIPDEHLREYFLPPF